MVSCLSPLSHPSIAAPPCTQQLRCSSATSSRFHSEGCHAKLTCQTCDKLPTHQGESGLRGRSACFCQSRESLLAAATCPVMAAITPPPLQSPGGFTRNTTSISFNYIFNLTLQCSLKQQTCHVNSTLSVSISISMTAVVSRSQISLFCFCRIDKMFKIRRHLFSQVPASTLN